MCSISGIMPIAPCGAHSVVMQSFILEHNRTLPIFALYWTELHVLRAHSSPL